MDILGWTPYAVYLQLIVLLYVLRALKYLCVAPRVLWTCAVSVLAVVRVAIYFIPTATLTSVHDAIHFSYNILHTAYCTHVRRILFIKIIFTRNYDRKPCIMYLRPTGNRITAVIIIAYRIALAWYR